MVHIGHNIIIPWKVSIYRPLDINTCPRRASNSETKKHCNFKRRQLFYVNYSQFYRLDSCMTSLFLIHLFVTVAARDPF